MARTVMQATLGGLSKGQECCCVFMLGLAPVLPLLADCSRSRTGAAGPIPAVQIFPKRTFSSWSMVQQPVRRHLRCRKPGTCVRRTETQSELPRLLHSIQAAKSSPKSIGPTMLDSSRNRREARLGRRRLVRHRQSSVEPSIALASVQ
jgi:hypothetical protein